MLLAYATVNFLVVVLTAVIFATGTVWYCTYGEVPTEVTITWYLSCIADVVVAEDKDSPLYVDSAAESTVVPVPENATFWYSLLCVYEKSEIVPGATYCWPTWNINGSYEESVTDTSEYVDVKSLERLSIDAALIFVVPLNVANESVSLNSKSIANLDCEFSVAVNADASVKLPDEPVDDVMNFGDSPVPGPVVILSFAPL